MLHEQQQMILMQSNVQKQTRSACECIMFTPAQLLHFMWDLTGLKLNIKIKITPFVQLYSERIAFIKYFLQHVSTLAGHLRV
jgi:hypothetical protein